MATVMLEANADKVYETAVKSLRAHPEITVIDKNAKKREVKFARGGQVASPQATLLGDKLTQLVIASNLTGRSPVPHRWWFKARSRSAQTYMLSAPWSKTKRGVAVRSPAT
jgi:hypothetical protein